jgi:hypothetical protein
MPDRFVNETKLAPGDRLIGPIFGEGKLKLLDSNWTLDERLIHRLAERGITEAAVERTSERATKNPRKASLPKSSVSQESEFTAPHLINYRCRCGAIVTIHPPIPDLRASVWRCTACAANYIGATAKSNSFKGIELVGVEIPDPRVGENGVDSRPAEDSTVDADTSNRRQYNHYAVAAPIVAVPLGLHFNITGHAERMRILNISQSGVALAHTRFTNASFFALDFSFTGMELLQVLIQVLRITHRGPSYEVIGRFISRLQSADNG